MEDKKEMIITDKDGNSIKYEIITAFILTSTKKNYIVYTDNKKSEDGNINIYASIYYPDDLTRLDDIETQEEWDEIHKIMENLI